MLYNPRKFDSWKDDLAANEHIAAWIENNYTGAWLRWGDEPVKLVYLSVPHVEHPINAIRLKQGAKVQIRRFNGEEHMILIDALKALGDPDTLLCLMCEGDGIVNPLNNPTGTRCPDCFGSGRFLHALK